MSEDSLPFFSIVVPTFDRPRQIAACLESLTRLEYPPERFEVIVVDDGSPLPPRHLVEAVQDRLDVTLVTQENAGPAKARNTGAARARGAYLAFTDDDCAPAPDWLHALRAGFAEDGARALGGRTVNALPDNIYSTASQMLIDYIYAYFNPDPKEAQFFASNNLAFPAAGFREIGGFDTTYPRAAAEDRELCRRWVRRGGRMAYLPAARVYHAHDLSLRRFWRQHFTYGRGAYCYHRLRARDSGEQIRVEPGGFYANLLRHPFRHTARGRAARVAALLFLSQAANAGGFFWEKLMAGGERDMKNKNVVA